MKKAIILSFFILVVFAVYAAWEIIKFYPTNKLTIVVCDVGQGDGVFIRTPQGTDILFDAGPDDAILNCLSHNMPFWDRTIELIIISHPHLDHFEGVVPILERYKVRSFVTEDVINTTSDFSLLQKKLKEMHIPTRLVSQGDVFSSSDGVILKVLSPSEAFLKETTPNKIIGEKNELVSVILLLSFGEFDLLLTGDSQVPGITESLSQVNHRIDVLQVPHHGSFSGMDTKVTSDISAALATISVGKNNKYGHPHKTILELLKQQGVSVIRTDQKGDIIITTDGKKWSVKTRKNDIN